MPSLQLVPGAIIAGKYRLLRHIGDGGMGSVWAVRNEFVDRDFALKLVNPGGTSDAEFRARLLREAKAMGRIQHRNVAEVYDVGQAEDGSPFLVMQLLSGETLEQRLTTKRKLETDAALNIALDMAKGLGAAHAAGVVHRDLKPANVFLHWDTDHGTVVKVLDFGVSKMLASEAPTGSVTGLAIGSPAYMSPEQARGDRKIDQRSDIWAFGVVLYEMLAGVRPFEGETAYDLVAEILKGEIPDIATTVPNVESALRALIARCMVRDRSQRLVTAADLVSELQSLSEQRARTHATQSAPRVAAAAVSSLPFRAAETSSPEIAPTQKIPPDPRVQPRRVPATVITPPTPSPLSEGLPAAATTGTSTHLTSTRTARSGPFARIPKRTRIGLAVVAGATGISLIALMFTGGQEESADRESATSDRTAASQVHVTPSAPVVAPPTLEPQARVSLSALPVASAVTTGTIPKPATQVPTPRPRAAPEPRPRTVKSASPPAPRVPSQPTPKPKKGGLGMPGSPG